LTPVMRVRTAVGYRRCLGEYRRGNDTGFDNLRSAPSPIPAQYDP
jgi:hypothetical protein